MVRRQFLVLVSLFGCLVAQSFRPRMVARQYPPYSGYQFTATSRASTNALMFVSARVYYHLLVNARPCRYLIL